MVVIESEALADPSYRAPVAVETAAVVVTDPDWAIEQVNIEVVGLPGPKDECGGASLVGLLQPGQVQELTSAVSRVSRGGPAASVRVRIRAADDSWREFWSMVTASSGPAPPRLGLLLVAIPETSVDVISEIRQRVAAFCSDTPGAAAATPPSEALSARQGEILTRLVRGEGIKTIAAALYLSPSTVRNHLTAIYRKFGVHSQAGVLAKLFEARDPP